MQVSYSQPSAPCYYIFWSPTRLMRKIYISGAKRNSKKQLPSFVLSPICKGIVIVNYSYHYSLIIIYIAMTAKNIQLLIIHSIVMDYAMNDMHHASWTMRTVVLLSIPLIYHPHQSTLVIGSLH